MRPTPSQCAGSSSSSSDGSSTLIGGYGGAVQELGRFRRRRRQRLPPLFRFRDGGGVGVKDEAAGFGVEHRRRALFEGVQVEVQADD